MKSNIILIGMSGAGKSTIGVLLAKKLGMDFIDTDILLQKKTGKLLQPLIEEKGNDGFLKLEEEVLLSLNPENCVIATGGSAVYSEKGIEYLKLKSECVYLYVPLEEILKRLKKYDKRGIVMNGASSLEELYDQRSPLYRKYKDIEINCTQRGAQEVCDILIECLKD